MMSTIAMPLREFLDSGVEYVLVVREWDQWTIRSASRDGFWYLHAENRITGEGKRIVYPNWEARLKDVKMIKSLPGDDNSAHDGVPARDHPPTLGPAANASPLPPEACPEWLFA